MNKQLFEKVKTKCKDTGLAEKYLQAITEKMGGSIEDDSTDDEAIEKTANLIADVAKESQREATRWANKKNQDKKPKETEGEEEEEEEETKGGKGGKSGKKDQESEELKAIRRELDELKNEKAKSQRSKAISDAMEKHKIPVFLRDKLNIADDTEDIDAAVASLKQDLITNGLVSADSEGTKAASEKQIDEAADDLLNSITVK